MVFVASVPPPASVKVTVMVPWPPPGSVASCSIRRGLSTFVVSKVPVSFRPLTRGGAVVPPPAWVGGGGAVPHLEGVHEPLGDPPTVGVQLPDVVDRGVDVDGLAYVAHALDLRRDMSGRRPGGEGETAGRAEAPVRPDASQHSARPAPHRAWDANGSPSRSSAAMLGGRLSRCHGAGVPIVAGVARWPGRGGGPAR